MQLMALGYPDQLLFGPRKKKGFKTAFGTK